MKLQNPTFPYNHGAGPDEAPLVRNMKINYWAPCFILLICLIFCSTEGTRQLNYSSPLPHTMLSAPFLPLQRPEACLFAKRKCGGEEDRGDASTKETIVFPSTERWVKTLHDTSPFDSGYFTRLFCPLVATAEDSGRKKSKVVASALSAWQPLLSFQGELFPLPSFWNLLLFLR